MKYALEAEELKDNPTILATPLSLECLDIKWGRALRAVLPGDMKRELATLEEKAARESASIIGGGAIYALVCQYFRRSARHGRAQALEELRRLQASTMPLAATVMRDSVKIKTKLGRVR